MPAILAKKLGMTQRFADDGRVERVTVLEAGPCPVTAIRTVDRDGYEAVQLAFGACKEKSLTKPELGHLKKADASAHRHLVEFRNEVGELLVGQTVTVDAFSPGDQVKISGRTKGKGFQGTIKRHGFASGPKSHGSHNVRAPGSVGASATPSRVFKGMRLPGQMGNKRVTQRGITVVDVRAADNLLLVRGAVPGPRNGVVEVRSALSLHAGRGSLAVLDPAPFADTPSAKQAAALLADWSQPRGVLVVLTEEQAKVALSFRNLDRVSVLPAQGVGIADIVGASA